jgi:hypothetical protein
VQSAHVTRRFFARRSSRRTCLALRARRPSLIFADATHGH